MIWGFMILYLFSLRPLIKTKLKKGSQMLTQKRVEYWFVNGDVLFLCNSNDVYNENKALCDGF